MNNIALATTNLSLFRLPEIQKDTLNFMLRQFHRHGPFIHYPLRFANAYLLTHPELVTEVFVNRQRHFSKDTVQFNLLANFTGRGLLTSNGRYWLRQRRLSQPAFHHRRITALSDMIVTTTDRLCRRWQARGDSFTVDIDDVMMNLALEIVGQALFGADLHGRTRAITRATVTILNDIVARAQNPLLPPTAVPTPRNQRIRAAQATLDGVVAEAMHARQTDAEPRDDILGMLLAARDRETGAPMTPQQIRDEMMTFLIAGHETSAAGLTWIFHLLDQHPEAACHLQTELDAVLNGRLPTAADLPCLPYLEQVMQESMRLYPPSWLLSRRAESDVSIAGVRIPAGSLAIISPYTIHRHPAFWPRPYLFDPDRFTPERPLPHRHAYIPFGAGPRLCIGDSFARTEIRLVLATILQRFRLAQTKSDPPEPVALVTIRPRNGLPMRVVRHT